MKQLATLLVSATALVAAEGRQRPSDQGENDILMIRSTDGGRTWSALRAGCTTRRVVAKE